MAQVGNPNKKRMHRDGRLYGKYGRYPNTQISREDLKRALAGKKLSTGHQPKFCKPTRDKAYLAFMFFVGCRKLEATLIKKEDMKLVGRHLVFLIPAFKHGIRGGPLKLNLDKIEGAEYILKKWRKTRRGRFVFKLSSSTAYRIVTRALGVCPHWLRHNWITTAQQKLAGNPSDVDTKIMTWTGHKSRASLDHYRLKTEKTISEVSEMEM